MSRNISAAVYEKHGNPADVLNVETRPWPTPAADEAVVKMYAAPINPADLNQIEGKYPVRPELPATPGFEGAGVIVELGTGVKNLTGGALVILPHNVGTWRDAVAVKADELVVVPDGIERRCTHSFRLEFSRRRQGVASRQLSRAWQHTGKLWCNELAAAENSDRSSDFQRPAISRHLDQQMVRQRQTGRAHRDVSTDF